MATAKYKLGKDGYYSAQVWDGTYVNGKKHRIHLRSKKSSRDLENKVHAFQMEVEARKHIRQTDILFLDYAKDWRTIYKQRCSNGTKAMYDNIIKKHFIAVGTTRLQDIDRIHLEIILNHADGKIRTQQQIQMTFKQVIKAAVADHLFPANVADEIFRNAEPVKYAPAEKRTLSSEERMTVFSADLALSDKIFVYILYGCGLRRGEALALTIFDFKGQSLVVSKSHEFIGNDPAQKPPKSSNGYRTVPIPDRIWPDLEKYIADLKKNGQTYLFTMKNGEPMTKSSYDCMWKRITSALNAPDLTAHVFRHNYCSNLCYQIPEISIKRIAQLMGDTEKMVLDVYNHIILEKEDARKAVNDAL